ncbi:MAG TPA: UTP--glucose-1-phosphate uridylyltransferase GalU [Oligoflexia bacterium]|nr:UTP--glucose-1-phosphate uridylyltransferase GalU [Oligoflexia bacterium]HMP47346.1 UTP--glucose-1-phosphate uridylyltransferase GalU [Oligoflexia bacterium]
MSIKKAVIPAAGLGTRFLPATKAVPKEMLPIIDVPTIQYIVKEAVDSGIEEIIFITSKGKDAILDHFDTYHEMEQKLEREGKNDLLALLRETSQMAKFVSVRQPQPKGLGDAVYCAKDLIGDEPFVVLLGDDLVDASVPCTRQMIEVYNRHGKSVAALMRVGNDDVSKFGICGGHSVSERVYELDTMVEKPTLEEAPSNLAIVGRYILKPSIFKYLEETPPGKSGEIQLTDAMARMMKVEGFVGYEFIGERYDAGDKFGFIQANIAFALKRRDIGPRLRSYLKEVVDQTK